MAKALVFKTPHGTWTHVTNRDYQFAVIARKHPPPGRPQSPECLAFVYDQRQADLLADQARATGKFDFVEVYPVSETQPARSARKTWFGITYEN